MSLQSDIIILIFIFSLISILFSLTKQTKNVALSSSWFRFFFVAVLLSSLSFLEMWQKQPKKVYFVMCGSGVRFESSKTLLPINIWRRNESKTKIVKQKRWTKRKTNVLKDNDWCCYEMFSFSYKLFVFRFLKKNVVYLQNICIWRYSSFLLSLSLLLNVCLWHFYVIFVIKGTK